MAKNVYFVMYDGVQLLDVSGPAGVLAMVNTVLNETIYEIHYVSANVSGSITANSNMVIQTEKLPPINEEDYIIVPGALEKDLDAALTDTELLDWLMNTAYRANVKISVCLGAFFFAELGWLKHKRATTHWAKIDRLKTNYPDVLVLDDTLYQNDGDVWSSGGVLAGVDMMLALVIRDFSVEVALKVAKLLVVYLFRDGGQPQYSTPIEFQAAAKDRSLVALVAWLENRLDQPTSVKEMAEYSAMSVRKLTTRCQEFFKLGPAQLLTEMRLENARTLLRDEKIPIQDVAYRCGFAQTATFSRAFSRRYGIPPSRYRESFQVPE